MQSDEQLMGRLATDLRLAGKAERTVEAYTGALRRLGRTCRKPLAEISEDDVRGYLEGMVRGQAARGTFSINLRLIQSFLGHSSPRTTQIYTHLTREVRAAARNPVDRLMERSVSSPS